MRAYQKEWHLKNRERLRAVRRKNYLENKENYFVRHIKNRRKIRRKVLELMGGKCVQCDFSDPRALQINHIHNNGANKRRKLGGGVDRLYSKILKMNKKDIKAEYQLLCANCNNIKRFRFEEEKTISKYPSLDSERFEVLPGAKEV